MGRVRMSEKLTNILMMTLERLVQSGDNSIFAEAQEALLMDKRLMLPVPSKRLTLAYDVGSG